MDVQNCTTPPKPCEGCGRCPTCGQGGRQAFPYMPYNPWPWQPSVYPWWAQTTTITVDSTSGTSNPGNRFIGVTY